MFTDHACQRSQLPLLTTYINLLDFTRGYTSTGSKRDEVMNGAPNFKGDSARTVTSPSGWAVRGAKANLMHTATATSYKPF